MGYLLINSFLRSPHNFNPSGAYMLTKYKTSMIEWLYNMHFVNNLTHFLYYEKYPQKLLNIFSKRKHEKKN